MKTLLERLPKGLGSFGSLYFSGSLLLYNTMTSYNHIINNVYIGNRHSIEHHAIFSLIINCTKTDVAFPPDCSAVCIRLPVEDIPDEADKLYNLIHDNNILEMIYTNVGNVLVHCNAGRQRSCAVVACYLIKYHNMKPYDAISFIKSRRREAFFGSINFLETLKKICRV
jgi:predicted protein tyrosine phosphatase